MFRKEVNRLVLLGMPKEANEPERGAPSFAQQKPKTDRIIFLSDFRNLNRQLKQKPYPMSKIREMILHSEGFQYATSLELNMGYYHTCLRKKQATCVLLYYHGEPMGMCNPLDNFQEKTNKMFREIEFIRACINDLLIITRGG